jgi:hypothetical protein
MKDVFIFLAIISPLICLLAYLILKHDAPSRIVDTYRIKVSEDR